MVRPTSNYLIGSLSPVGATRQAVIETDFVYTNLMTRIKLQKRIEQESHHLWLSIQHLSENGDATRGVGYLLSHQPLNCLIPQQNAYIMRMAMAGTRVRLSMHQPCNKINLPNSM